MTHILIVSARFYPDIAEELAAGAITTLDAQQATHEQVWVPGAFEIPAAIRFALTEPSPFGRGQGEGVATSLTPNVLRHPHPNPLPKGEGMKRYDGFVALGCVIRGETTHYNYVCAESARGLMDLALQHQVAIGYGILTVENEKQAWVRAGLDQGNKGGDAAAACLRMIELKRRFGGEA